jgi:hypothetical protein
MRILPLPDPRHRPRPAAHRTRAPQQTRFVFPKTDPAAKTPAAPPLWPSTQYARSSPARIRPGSARTARRPDATGTLAAKSVLKIQHQPTPPLHGSRPHGRQNHHLPAGAEPGSAGHLQHPDQGAGTARGRSTGIPASPGPGAAAAARRQPEPARQACSQGTGNGVEVMQVGMVTANGP